MLAEVVETEAQLDLMRELGVDKVQGFRFAPACPAKRPGPGSRPGRDGL